MIACDKITSKKLNISTISGLNLLYYLIFQIIQKKVIETNSIMNISDDDYV